MLVVAILMTLQVALAAAMLAPLWSNGRFAVARGSRLIDLAAYLPLLLAIPLIWLVARVPLGDVAGVGQHVAPGPASGRLIALPIALGLYAIQMVVFLQLHKRAARQGEGEPKIFLTVAWLAFSLFTQCVMTRFALAILAEGFARKYVVSGMSHVLSQSAIELMLLLGVATAALLLTWAVAGAVAAWSMPKSRGGEARDEQDEAAREEAAILRSGAWMLMLATFFRLAAIIFSVALAISSHPFGPSHFITISLAPGSTMIIVRMILGLGLPFIYALLVLEALGQRLIRQAAFQFHPAVLMIVIGELLAAGLTAGMWGIAF